MKLHRKAKYLLEVLPKFLAGQGRACPSCGCTASTLVQRKYRVMALRRCSRCELMFRVPTTSREENERFYQSEYSQGFTTSLPAEDELELYKDAFRDYPYLLSSGDFDERKIRDWALGLSGDQVTLDLTGIELLLIVRMRS